MAKYARSTTTALLLTFVLVLQGCTQSQAQIDRASKASRNLANYTGEVITITATLYATKVISLALKDQLAQVEHDFAVAGSEFNKLVASLQKQYGSGVIPASVWSTVVTQFDQLSKTFLALVNLIPQAAGLKDSKAFRTISAAVVALANILMQNAKYLPMPKGFNIEFKYKSLIAALKKVEVDYSQEYLDLYKLAA